MDAPRTAATSPQAEAAETVPGGERASSGARDAPTTVVRKLLAIPVFYKILIANAVLLVVLTLVGATLAARYAGPPEADVALRLTVGLSAIVLVVGAGLSAAFIRLALRPLRELEAAARLVEAGDTQSRVAGSRLADADTARLIIVFNRMLDRLERHRERQRELTLRSLDAEENARRWVARRLYDECAQSLAAVLLQLRAAVKRPESRDPEAFDAQFEGLREELLRALDGIRTMARELRPPELDELGISAAVAAYARSLAADAKADIDVHAQAIDTVVPGRDAHGLYRIVQEALGNAVRHANADRIFIRLGSSVDGAWAEVADDGVGFDVEAELERAGRGLGLLAMHERARHLGAELSIFSKPGDGTRVRLHMPAGRSAQTA